MLLPASRHTRQPGQPRRLALCARAKGIMTGSKFSSAFTAWCPARCHARNFICRRPYLAVFCANFQSFLADVSFGCSACAFLSLSAIEIASAAAAT